MNLQSSLTPRFDGQTYNHERDHDRLAGQLGRVKDVMADGQWRTLWGIAELTSDPESSVSARLRDLRKPKFGGYIIERKYWKAGLWQYRMIRE